MGRYRRYFYALLLVVVKCLFLGVMEGKKSNSGRLLKPQKTQRLENSGGTVGEVLTCEKLSRCILHS
jgi:hypothetical protein